MAGVKGKAGRKKRYHVEVYANITTEQAEFLALFSAAQSEAVRKLIDTAKHHGIHAQCADVSKAA